MEPGSFPEAGLGAELDDDDDDEDEGAPEAKKRRLQCTEFAKVAGCDAAVAQCYLAENDWEMEVSAGPGSGSGPAHAQFARTGLG